MKVLVLLLLLGLQGYRCTGEGNDCERKLCNSCTQVLGAYNCGDLSMSQAHTIINLESFSECTCTKFNVIVQVIGSLTGLLLVILVLVVTGWVWTCWALKKKKKEIQNYKKCQESDSEEERFCLNQIYKMTTTQPVVSTAMEQPLDSLEESRQSNNGLSSKDNKDHCGVRRVENLYTSSEGSSHSSLQEERRVNRVEEGKCGEKHVYHVLEKPGSDDYEELDKTLEENTAMEYKTPVPISD